MSTGAPLMVTVSGIRGIVGESLFPAVIEKYTGSFAALLASRKKNPDEKLKMVIGRDSRVTGPWVVRLVQSIIMASGFDVVDLGIVPTPTVQYAVTHHKVAGGVIVTSSHNPMPWNGLKFVDEDGLFLSPENCKKIFEMADSGDISRQYAQFDQFGSISEYDDEVKDHIDAILSLPYVAECVETVRSHKYRVCLDAVNGAGGLAMKMLLERFGCEIIGLYLEPTGLFSHTPEPIPQNLGDLCDAVKKNKADFGIAVDPDVDRCVFVDDKGECLGEEYTLAFAFKFVLGVVGKRGAVCRNLSSSRVLDDISHEHGCTMYPAPVGEINVAKEMLRVEAVIGGEGNGGVMLPDIHIGRDAPVAAALALCLMGGYQYSISELKAKEMPSYHIAKMKAPLSGLDPDVALKKIRDQYLDTSLYRLTETDGLRIDHEEWWIHLRKSNTEPILRVIGEAGRGKSQQESDDLCRSFMKQITEIS